MEYKSVQDIVEDLRRDPIESSGLIYHPIPFPEFAGLRTSSNANEVYRKWGLIIKWIRKMALRGLEGPEDLEGLRVLDIGANAGFYTFTLAKEGARVTSFELHPRYAAIGRFLTREKGLPVEWHGVTFDFNLIRDKRFDVALMLSVFQWMAGGDENSEEACTNLRRISSICGYMVFELGYNSGKSCLRTDKRNHYAALIKFLRTNTEYAYFKLIGTTRLWNSGRRYLVICSHNRRFDDAPLHRLARSIGI